MTSVEAIGRRLLAEVEEGSLEDLLKDLRTFYHARTLTSPARLGIPTLDALWTAHGSRSLSITGSGALPLLYHIVSAAVSSMPGVVNQFSPRSGTIVVLDLNGRFDVSRLSCSVEDLKHVHVMQVQKGRLREAVESVESYLLGTGGGLGGDRHRSMGREWVGTCVNGGVGGDVCVGWKGWLRVESERGNVEGFGAGMSVEEALRQRDERQELVDCKGWRAVCEWGEYRFKES